MSTSLSTLILCKPSFTLSWAFCPVAHCIYKNLIMISFMVHNIFIFNLVCNPFQDEQSRRGDTTPCLKSQKKFWSVRIGKILGIMLEVQPPCSGNGEADVQELFDPHKSSEWVTGLEHGILSDKVQYVNGWLCFLINSGTQETKLELAYHCYIFTSLLLRC